MSELARERPPDPPRRVARLLQAPDVVVADVVCHGVDRDWSPLEPSDGYALVFVRSGGFDRRVDGRTTFVDASVVYFERPGEDQSFAHPDGGDSCTVVRLDDGFLASIVEGDPALPAAPLHTAGRIDLAHRRLVARLRRGSLDAIEGAEAVVDLVGGTLAAALPDLSARRTRGRDGARLVDLARQVLAAEEWSTGLVELAGRVGRSPYHLSRAFRAETGETFSRYRRRLRVRAALERLEAGEDDLASLAADLGFADQSHLARTMREHHGMSPSAARRLLTGTGTGPA